jgi:hypothetical protein
MPGLPRLEDEQKTGVIWYKNFRQFPNLSKKSDAVNGIKIVNGEVLWRLI